MTTLRVTGIAVTCDCGWHGTMPNRLPRKDTVRCPWCAATLFDSRPKWIRWLTGR